jgi:hypothetical protein
MREEQKVAIINGAVWTLTGKRGTLTNRERNEWVDIGNDANKDSHGDSVAIGTWKCAGQASTLGSLAVDGVVMRTRSGVVLALRGLPHPSDRLTRWSGA